MLRIASGLLLIVLFTALGLACATFFLDWGVDEWQANSQRGAQFSIDNVKVVKDGQSSAGYTFNGDESGGGWHFWAAGGIALTGIILGCVAGLPRVLSTPPAKFKQSKPLPVQPVAIKEKLPKLRPIEPPKPAAETDRPKPSPEPLKEVSSPEPAPVAPIAEPEPKPELPPQPAPVVAKAEIKSESLPVTKPAEPPQPTLVVTTAEPPLPVTHPAKPVRQEIMPASYQAGSPSAPAILSENDLILNQDIVMNETNLMLSPKPNPAQLRQKNSTASPFARAIDPNLRLLLKRAMLQLIDNHDSSVEADVLDGKLNLDSYKEYIEIFAHELSQTMGSKDGVAYLFETCGFSVRPDDINLYPEKRWQAPEVSETGAEEGVPS
ncbi:MAG: hypothetical protein LBD30_01825 [Verrucomicrobiales bacterium]|jgi:hypothetical protein|nr:hypothetical protein [Verrucomicrobiales bacterium]